jgi:hypothetical protein
MSDIEEAKPEHKRISIVPQTVMIKDLFFPAQKGNLVT